MLPVVREKYLLTSCYLTMSTPLGEGSSDNPYHRIPDALEKIADVLGTMFDTVNNLADTMNKISSTLLWVA